MTQVFKITNAGNAAIHVKLFDIDFFNPEKNKGIKTNLLIEKIDTGNNEYAAYTDFLNPDNRPPIKYDKLRVITYNGALKCFAYKIVNPEKNNFIQHFMSLSPVQQQMDILESDFKETQILSEKEHMWFDAPAFTTIYIQFICDPSKQ